MLVDLQACVRNVPKAMNTKSQCLFLKAFVEVHSQKVDSYESPMPSESNLGLTDMAMNGCRVLQALSIVSHHSVIATASKVEVKANGENALTPPNISNLARYVKRA